MLYHAKWLSLATCLVLVGCFSSPPPVPADGSSGGDVSGGDTSDGSTDGDTTSDGGATGGITGGNVALTGKILAPGAAKAAPRSQTADETYTVLAQSDDSGEVYRATTDADGDFELDIPDDEAGSSFMVTILGPDAQAVGPVLFGEADGDGLTGLAPDGETSLGTIALPDDPAAEPIEPGTDSDVDDLVDPDLTARVDGNGVPVGLASHGKGAEAQDQTGDGGQLVDADRDGLIDVFDADDDGDGLVDDFESGGSPGGLPADMIVNFFMNLKIGAEQASTYYNGTAAEIDVALGTDTIITFEVMTEPSATRAITGAQLLDSPAPSYLPNADRMSDGTGGLAFAKWADSNYAFNEASDRFEAFVRPNAVMDAGDTFTVEVSFDDGTTEQYSRMINYVFKNIPKLVQYGTAAALTAFDVTDTTANGSPSQPIHFDGTQDLVLVFNPPLDETGAYLTDLDYTFGMFYYDSAHGSQIQVDATATWPAPPVGFQSTTYYVANQDLTLSAQNTYTVILPQELFPDTVKDSSGATQTISAYKIDITAECTSGNAAILLMFEKD